MANRWGNNGNSYKFYPWEEGMETHSIILAWRIPWPEEPGGLQFHSVAESDMTEET